MDLLAEALQNATDAVDTRSELESSAPRAIEIAFDAEAASFSVIDTGIGMPLRELKLALAPNISFKTGELAHPRRLRARGEKGVGLSFIALACDELTIRTCNGKELTDATIRGANSWLRGGRGKAPPVCTYRVYDSPSDLLGSSRWTAITVTRIDPEHFDSDLFEMSIDELVWQLRTETAIGNTSYLFAGVGRLQTRDIKVTLRYTSRRGTKAKPKTVPYKYLTPEEFLSPQQVVDFDAVKDLEPFARRRQLRGKALRHVAREARSGERIVDFYALVIDGREMRRILAERKTQRKLVPPSLEWQGLQLAVRDMPAGVALAPGLLGTRTWEQRLFGLLQYDDLALDLGRKTIAARTRSMLNSVVSDAWASRWGTVAQQVQPSPRLDSEGGRKALQARIERARALPALDAPIPYLKQPTSVEATQAIFHELVGTASSLLHELRPLNSRVFASEDALIYTTSPNGELPLHVVFGLVASDIVHELEGDDQYAATADLAVVWQVDEGELETLGLRATRLTGTQGDAATHSLELAGIGRRESIRLLALEVVLASET